MNRATLSIRIPGFGSEFTVGFNCTAIEQEGEALLIRNPLTEHRHDPCDFDLRVVAPYWAHEPRQAVSAPASDLLYCSICGNEFATTQGLGSHMTKKHPGEKAQK